MKIKSLLLAFPVLCFACSSSSTDVSDPALQMEAGPILAKQVTGVHSFTNDFNYEAPCHILEEALIRQTLNLSKEIELEEGHEHDGCAFEWAGNKVILSFGGAKPFSSIQVAEYNFDHLYQGKPTAVVEEPVEEANEATTSGPEPEGTNSETPATDSAEHKPVDSHPTHSGVTAAMPSPTQHAVKSGNYEPVSGVGDKAVWDASTSQLHVLYNNHIINVTVESKGKAVEKKHQAETLSEVLIEKIAENEYTKRL
ncbi:hypothetical protein IC229_26820 [Spirosoma sp. BT702]|uniref:Lipoprotein n=1 Tax=Spirosoma profusum TaxID=2771354 RepID=A0A926Y5B4_9BACT|nr:hypothetical protein [Spirosoma profusum]MBD2704286.1 hypothetical protein [Spirosoma profusum]